MLRNNFESPPPNNGGARSSCNFRFSYLQMLKFKPEIRLDEMLSNRNSTVARQSPAASGWLGVSGLSAPATATVKQTSNLISQMSPASD